MPVPVPVPVLVPVPCRSQSQYWGCSRVLCVGGFTSEDTHVQRKARLT